LSTLNSNGLHGLYDFFDPNKKILYITYDIKHTKLTLKLGIPNYFNVCTNPHGRDRLLYMECAGCFYYYVKLLPIIEHMKIYVNTKRITTNIGKDVLDPLKNLDFIDHICKENNLYKLLVFINKKCRLPLHIDDIIKIVTNKGTKNAKSNLIY